MMDAAAGEVTRSAANHIEREVGYTVHFKRNVRYLLVSVEKLAAASSYVQRMISNALNNGDLIREPVENWIARANKVEEESRQLCDEARLVSSWYRGWLSFSRFRLGRKAEKKNIVVQGLLAESDAFGGIVSDPKPFQMLEIVSSGDFDAFRSRESTTELILEALKDDEVSLLGVYGMPGVGKTMLMEALCKQVKAEKLFDEVVMVTVSQNPDEEIIQLHVAKALDMHSDVLNYSLKYKIYDRLTKSKKTLVVLDDLWERLELSKLGIPDKIRSAGCKVVFTTRGLDVCGKMESDINVEVKVLSKADSWGLFQKRAVGTSNLVLPIVAKDIADECEGLPLAIATVARALRGKPESVWDNALQKLRKSTFKGMTPVSSSVILSYNFLPSEESRMCFLLCSLFPEDHEIDMDQMLHYVMGEKFVEGADTLAETRSSLEAILEEILSSCLLLRDEYGAIMMHDVVRDVAISIASEEGKGFIVKAGMGLKQWPDMQLEKSRRISLMNNEIRCDLPSQIKAPHLLTLCLNNNKDLCEIPSDFFNELINLATLDLSHTSLKTLPSSFSRLVNLRTLLMDYCEWTSISPIEQLKRLELLNIRGCDSEVLEPLWMLKNLKLLRLTSLPPKVVTSLYQLEELYLHRFDGKEEDGLSDVASLTSLSCLQMVISREYVSQDIPIQWGYLPKFVIFAHDYIATLKRYALEIGKFELLKNQYKRSMFLVSHFSSQPMAKWFGVLLRQTNYLYFVGRGFSSVVAQLNSSELNENLNRLVVSQCADVINLLSSDGVGKVPKYNFNNLEELCLSRLKRFEGLSNVTLPPGFLSRLRVLEVWSCKNLLLLIPFDLLQKLQNLQKIYARNCSRLETLILYEVSNCLHSPVFLNLKELRIRSCDKLTHVLPLRVVQGLLRLEMLEVWSCINMEIIFEKDNYEEKENESDAVLPRLKSLDLYELQMLSGFTRSTGILNFPALEVLTVIKCENLKKLPMSVNSVPKLKKLNADFNWFQQLEWEDQSLKSRLQSLL